jgi:hypothetical protein
MSYEVVRRASGAPVQRQARQSTLRIGSAVQVEQTVIGAKAVVGEFAINEVVYLKSMQRELGLAVSVGWLGRRYRQLAGAQQMRHAAATTLAGIRGKSVAAVEQLRHAAGQGQ